MARYYCNATRTTAFHHSFFSVFTIVERAYNFGMNAIKTALIRLACQTNNVWRSGIPTASEISEDHCFSVLLFGQIGKRLFLFSTITWRRFPLDFFNVLIST